MRLSGASSAVAPVVDSVAMLAGGRSSQTMDVQPMELYSRILRRWPWIFIVAVVGGILGIGISWLMPETYRSTAILGVGIDYGRSQWLDEDAERHVMNRIQDVLLADSALEGALERLDTDSGGLPKSVTEFRSRIHLVRIEASWQLTASAGSAEGAAATANAWAQSALSEVEEAAKHAWQAAELQGLFFEVSCRPQVLEASIDRSVWVCDEADPVQPTQGLPEELLREVELSRGLPPVISYSLVQLAAPPNKPAYSQRSLLALAGTALGLGLATLLAITAPDRPGMSTGLNSSEAARDSERESPVRDLDR